jgi:glycosyltransferase involved in cell wall biosynthesis
VRHVLRISQRVVVLGEQFRRHAIEAVGLPPAQVVKLFNAIPDLRRDYPEAARRPAPFPPGRPARLVMLANISARKGADCLLAAAAELKAAGHAFHLTLAGGGEIEAFQRQAAALGLAEVTDFPGWLDRSQAHRLLLDADALVLPSRAEGLPIAILEALCLGVPIVTTPVGAIPEVLEDGVTALIVPPGDAAALAAALGRLLRGEVAAAALAEAGRRLYDHAFAVEAYCDQWLALYAAAIGAAGRPLPGWATLPGQAAHAA